VKIVAVIGISGVGKSTIIDRAGRRAPLLHLKASDLIKARLAEPHTSEELRRGAVLDNQRLMLEEFATRIATCDQDTVIFDGHSLIDTPAGLLEIPLAVFAAIKPDLIVFIEDAPETIHARRASDSSRVRPNRDPSELTRQQRYARCRTASFASELHIPFHVLASDDVSALLALIA
jgi:adenylate kinase